MKSWTISEDKHLVAYFDLAGSFNMAIDLGRSEPAVDARVRRLKKTGAWRHLEELHEAYLRYQMAVGVGRSEFAREIVTEKLEQIESRRPKLTVVRP